MAEHYTFSNSMSLFDRAAKVMPGGIYGHESPAILVPGRYPYYVAKAQGSRFWDVDGNEYVDWMCAYGPILLGYGNQEIEKAVAKQRKKAICTSMPADIMVDLAEALVDTVQGADWAVFAKNGNDATTWAIRVAREHTGRKKILKAKGGYHGVHAWCTAHGGVIDEDHAHIHNFEFNDVESIKYYIDKYPGQIAAIISSPYHHPTFADSQQPHPAFWQRVRELCDKEGIILIVDDVRAGFRLDIRGSHAHYGFTPDLVCFSKALGHGYPLSACTGKEFLRPAAGNVFFTGSFWYNADAYAAALAGLEIMKRDNSIEYMNTIGNMLKDGLYKAAADWGLKIRMSGPAAIPYMIFDNENDFRRMQLFAGECSERGVFLHPHHNWFVSTAHTKEDVAFTLDVAHQAFKVVKDTFGG